jgi:putative transposase
VRLLLTAGQISDYSGARTLLSDLPAASFLLADKGYDANWFRDGLIGKGIWPCIPPKKNRKYRVSFDKTMYKQRHKVENMFGRLKDWRRIATRYDRCAHTFFAAICIAATIIWWL